MRSRPNCIKLGKKHAMYQKISNFRQKKDIYANRLHLWHVSVFYRPEHNAKKGPDEIEF